MLFVRNLPSRGQKFKFLQLHIFFFNVGGIVFFSYDCIIVVGINTFDVFHTTMAYFDSVSIEDIAE